MRTFKVGDTVKIKPLAYIKSTLDKDGKNEDGLYFVEAMEPYVGTIQKISYCSSDRRYTFEGIGYNWDVDWLEPALENKKIIDSKTHRYIWSIFGMCFQVLSDIRPNYSVFDKMGAADVEMGGFTWSNFPEFKFSEILNEHAPFPDWPILELDRESAQLILTRMYEDLNNRTTTRLSSKTFEKSIDRLISYGFTWKDTPEGYDYWNRIESEFYKGERSSIVSETESKLTSISTFKPKNHETKLQRKKSIVIRGTVPEGSITCGRKRKTSIAVGYLSNSVCIGG